MGGCCDADGYDGMFGARFSRHIAKRYRKRGLDKSDTPRVGFLAAQCVEGACVLEIVGGVGHIRLQPLRRGGGRATSPGLVDSFDADVREPAADAGHGDRVARHQVDLATPPDAVEPHDIAILHRVVRCYPDHQQLLTAAADHATAALVFSHQPRNPVSRAMFAAQNLAFRIRRTPFRGCVHEPGALTAAAHRGGLRPGYIHRGPAWPIVGLTASPEA
jgi:hypothetical protein